MTTGVHALLRALAAAHFPWETRAWDGVAVPLTQPPAVMTTIIAALMSILSATWKLACASRSVMYSNHLLHVERMSMHNGHEQGANSACMQA